MNTKLLALALLRLLSKPSIVAYGTPEEDEAARKAEADAKAKEEEAKKKSGKLYTEDEFNRHTAAQRRQHESEMKKQAAELERLASDKRLTEEERESYAKRLDEVESQFKTAKEMEEKRVKKVQEDYDKRLKTAEETGKQYKSKYEEVLMTTELTREALNAEEQVPGQLALFVKPNTVIAPELDGEGKPTGRDVVFINLDDSDKDGNPVKLQLRVKDAYKRMKEIPERYGNLFKGTGSGGVGGSNGKGSSGTGGNMPTETNSYMAKRKEAGLAKG